MKTQVLNYRIIIEPEKQGKKTVYNAYCPTLGVADYGDTIDEALRNINSLVKFHIECLLEDGLEVPEENTNEEIITSTKIYIEGSEAKPQVVVGWVNSLRSDLKILSVLFRKKDLSKYDKQAVMFI